MVLRVANARALIIDLRRLWYLQWITTQTDSDNCAIIRVSDYIACTLLVMALKATAWCRVLIAQFEEYFDAALRGGGSRQWPTGPGSGTAAAARVTAIEPAFRVPACSRHGPARLTRTSEAGKT